MEKAGRRCSVCKEVGHTKRAHQQQLDVTASAGAASDKLVMVESSELCDDIVTYIQTTAQGKQLVHVAVRTNGKVSRFFVGCATAVDIAESLKPQSWKKGFCYIARSVAPVMKGLTLRYPDDHGVRSSPAPAVSSLLVDASLYFQQRANIVTAAQRTADWFIFRVR